MAYLINGLREIIGMLVSRQPNIRFGGAGSTDWLPPVLGPSEISGPLFASMADASSAWYFERG